MVQVKLNYVRHSARKLRPVLSSFIGEPLDRAIDKSSIMPQDSARMLNKTLKMAASAAEEKKLEADQMVIAQVFATEGPKIKRSRANSRGRSNRYIKHLAHITVILEENKDKKTHSSKSNSFKPKAKIETKVRRKQ